MKPIILSATFFVLATLALLGLPKAVNFASTSVLAQNIDALQLPPQVAGIQKANILPKNLGKPSPEISATAVLVQDLSSDFTLFVKDPDKRVPIASTTKLMTALVAVDHFKANEVLTVPDLSNAPGSSMGLKMGEKLTFRSLLYGMLLNSGNDAAYTIAANYPGGISAFVTAMNTKAYGMNLVNTHFDNPAGFDSANHYSSAADLGKIARLAAEDSQLARVVSTKETTVSSIDKNDIHILKNLNKLLGLPGVLGMKTGTTPEAKENLVGLIERDNHKILTVVLGSNDRFGETEKLIDWAFSNFTFEQPAQ